MNTDRDRDALTAASLDGITALPDHGDDGAGVHVCCLNQYRSGFTRIGCRTLNEASEEGLVLEVGIVGLEVVLAGGGELDGGKLVPALLKALDDGANESTLDTVGLDSDEATPVSVGSFFLWRASEGPRGAGNQGMAG